MSLGGGDLQIILRRIRHGFIICDDTELCDKIISQDVENEQRRRNLAKTKSIDLEKTDLLALLRKDPDFILDELSHSPEWTANNVQVRRVRCETLGRLEEIKSENEAKRKVKVISWQDPSTNERRKQTDTGPSDSDEDIDDDQEDGSSLFQRRLEPMYPLSQKSPLTALMQSDDRKQNPFSQYAKFDGTSFGNSNLSKKVTIFFKFHKQKLVIVVATNATVEETIGFICYKYTCENREPVLTQKDPSKYLLYIGDDDGMAEEDIPPLTHSKPFGQYDFPYLMLVQTTTQSRPAIGSSSSEDSQNQATDPDSSFQDSSRSATPSPPDVRSLPSTTVVHAQETVNEKDPIDGHYRALESLNLKSYTFEYFYKQNNSKHVKVRIDVSGEQIRFLLAEKISKFPWQQLSQTTQRLIDCKLAPKDSSSRKDRTRVHLIFESQKEADGARGLQIFILESSAEAAAQFRDQILNIIKVKNPQARETYEQQHPSERQQSQSQQQQQQVPRDPTKKRRSILTIIGSGISGGNSSYKS